MNEVSTNPKLGFLLRAKGFNNTRNSATVARWVRGIWAVEVSAESATIIRCANQPPAHTTHAQLVIWLGASDKTAAFNQLTQKDTNP